MIDIQNLSYAYRKSEPLYDGLNLQLEPGNIYGLLGRNGAGKTTLLKLMLGLLFPQQGSISVNGYRPADRQPAFLEDVFLIQEEIYIPEMKISTYQKMYGPFYRGFKEQVFYDLLNEFELDPNRKTSALSYGQKKKVLIAFGVACNSKLFILDEPTNGLDIPSKSQFRKILATSISDDRVFLISTHQVRDMNNLIDPIIILEKGRVVMNEMIHKITSKLSFYNSYDAQPPENALYSERIPGGYSVVVPNTQGEETEVDIEALFNTVVMNHDFIKETFSKTAVS